MSISNPADSQPALPGDQNTNGIINNPNSSPESNVATRRPGPGLANLCFFTAVFVFLGLSVLAQVWKVGFIASSFIGQAGLALTAVVFCLAGRYNFKEVFSLRKIPWRVALYCVLIGLVGQFAARFPAALNQWIMQIFGPFPITDLIPNPKGDVEKILFVLIVAGMAPLCEEILNRGFVHAGYRRLSFGKTIFFVGLLFGIFHLYPFRFAYTFVLGMVLAYLVLVTKSIYSSILAHFGFNVVGAFAPWLLDWIKKITPETSKSLLEEANVLDFQTVITTLPISLAAAGLLFWLLRSATVRMKQIYPEIQLGYFGLAYKIGETNAPTESFTRPRPEFSYGRYGYTPAIAEPKSETVLIAPTPLSYTARSVWYISFSLIAMIYLYTGSLEILRRLNPPAPTSPPAAIKIISPAPEPGLVQIIRAEEITPIK